MRRPEIVAKNPAERHASENPYQRHKAIISHGYVDGYAAYMERCRPLSQALSSFRISMEEIAEEEWPDRMGEKLSSEEEKEAEEEGHYIFISDGDAYLPREVRIFAVAKRVERGVADGREAKLTTGETIEYK